MGWLLTRVYVSRGARREVGLVYFWSQSSWMKRTDNCFCLLFLPGAEEVWEWGGEERWEEKGVCGLLAAKV